MRIMGYVTAGFLLAFMVFLRQVALWDMFHGMGTATSWEEMETATNALIGVWILIAVCLVAYFAVIINYWDVEKLWGDFIWLGLPLALLFIPY